MSTKIVGNGGPSDVGPQVATLGPAQSLQSLLERCHASLIFRIVAAAAIEHSDARRAVALLRSCSNRPTSTGTGQQRDEFAASDESCHLIPGGCGPTIAQSKGVPRVPFDRIRYRRHDACVLLYVSDLIELNGDDLWRGSLVVRKATLALAKEQTPAFGFRGGDFEPMPSGLRPPA